RRGPWRALGIDGPPRKELAPAPLGQARRLDFDVAAQGVTRSGLEVSDDIVMIGLKSLRSRDVDLALELAHQLVPAAMSGVGGVVGVTRIESGLLADSLVVYWKVGPDIVAIFC